MIEKTSAYKTKDGQTFGTIEEAQTHALKTVAIDSSADEGVANAFSKLCVENKDSVIAILKLKPRKSKAGKAKPVRAAAPK